MGFSELVFLFFLGLIMFGPKKLPEMARQIGRIMAELRRASQEFQNQLADEVRTLDQENELTKTIGNLQITGTTARDRILNALTDTGNTIKSSVEEAKPAAEPTPQVAPVATPESASATETKETIH